MLRSTARQEWAAAWPMPLVAMFGIVGTAAFAYSAGLFIGPMTGALGWSRTQFSAGFVIQMLTGLVTLPIVGRLAQRFGPRRIVLVGIVTFAACFSLLGVADNDIRGWWILCVLLTAGIAGISQVVWVSALIAHFRASRGFALALALAGLGVGSVIWPPLALLAIGTFGWRLGFAALILPWAAIMLPLTFLLFRDPPDAPAQPVAAERRSGVVGALASPDFVCLMLAGGLFSGAYYGIAVNLVPILKAQGVRAVEAVGIASTLGLSAIVGRPVVGLLLDRWPTRSIAIAIFLLPALAVAILLYGGQGSVPAIAASIVLGFSAGGEMDVVTFIAAGRFGRDRFASFYAVLTAILAVFASLGPLAASMLFDATGSYRPYLLAVGGATLVGVVLMTLIPLGARRDDDAL